LDERQTTTTLLIHECQRTACQDQSQPLREGRGERANKLFGCGHFFNRPPTKRSSYYPSSIFSLLFIIVLLLVHMLRLTNAITAIGRRRSVVTTTITISNSSSKLPSSSSSSLRKNNKSFPSTMSFHFASSDYAKSFQGLPTPDIPKLKKSAMDYLDKFDKQSWYTDPVSVSLFVCLFVLSTPVVVLFYTVLTNTHASIFFSFVSML
jgi:hypothetical protein